MKSSVVTVTLNPALDKTITLARLQRGGLNRVKEIQLDPGGKGINVAKVLKQFQIDVLATGFIAGSQGDFIMKKLKNEGMKFHFLRIDGETRTNLKIVEEETKVTTEVNESGFEVSKKDLDQFMDEMEEILNESNILVLGGSLPPGVPDTIYRDFIEMANHRNVKTILDADGAALKEGIKAKPYAIKPNLFELEQLFGYELDSDEKIISVSKELLKVGISLIVISMGSKGSVVMDKEEIYRVTPFPIIPGSTVGAGDSMVAALVYSLLKEKSLIELAKWITTAGTVTASKPGTQVCTFTEVQRFLGQVQVSQIEADGAHFPNESPVLCGTGGSITQIGHD
ncbi:1-phosphofructokinase [Microaerobacter geothermalis]|uniref:1-phosphofructokinase n=1 Tax=Microaerobacter geothermalis TaxID=674972 RepID=UPI001F299AC3|nr:1-phosphofructokinase [Microaerobacter geothermalis]MCF6093939.1 1-phosphofructokinase [Microaerobacter geothermalis]